MTTLASHRELFGRRRLKIKVPNRCLTDKDLWLAARVAEGLKNTDIAMTLGTTENTIKQRLKGLYDKLGLWNRLELALWFTKREWGPPQALAKG
jgi:DNA-binding NarL/FixJ family response regulator